jgi:signal transduction histidine kinase
MKSMRTHSEHAMISQNGLALWNTWHRYAAGCEQYCSSGLAWMLFACAWLALWNTSHCCAAGGEQHNSTGRAFVAVGGQLLAAEEITTFKQFYELSRGQSSEGRPIRFQGVVLCYDLEWGQLYVHDGSEVRWFNPREISTQPASGQFVEITGTTTVAGNDNALTNLSLTVLKEGALPVAKPHAPAQLTNDLGQWVETSGRVRVVDFTRGRMQLSLHEGGQSCEVFVLGVPQTNEVKRLLGARVRVRGINDTQVAGGRLERVSMFVPGMEQVTVIEPTDANRVLPQAVSINSLLNRELGDWTNNPVRFNGSVVSSEPGKTLIVKDPTGVIHAQVIQSTVARNDDRVDVCGFLKVTPNETVLSDAWFEVIKPTPLAAAAATASSLPAGKVRRPEVLTKVSEILKLRKEESTQRWPVRLRGVVLYADPEWRNGFLQGQRGAVYFDLSQTEVRSGQWVELTGETGPGGFAPEILNASVKVLGTTNLPLAAKVDLTDLADGHLDAQWVEMEGVIQHVILGDGHLRLRVMTPGGKFNVLIPGFHNQTAPTNLVDAFVSIQGACASEMNARQQVIGATLHVPGLERISILEPAPADPFAVAAKPIASVGTFDPDHLAGRRVKVSGVVTLKIPDQGFFIQDPSDGILVREPRTNELQTGDVLDVIGFPVMGDFEPELQEVTFRRTGNTSNAVPRETTAEEILLHGADDGMLVTLEARLLQSVPHSANPQLVLQDGAIVFTARLEDAGQGWKMPALESGSVVRLSGVCSIQRGEQREPKSFRLRLRSPADVTLISSPPWLTAQGILWVLGGFGGVLVLSLAWVSALRRQVARQTSKLREQLAERERMQAEIEKTHKELLVVSRQAGMAEVATNVLHNVGNVLNSVNVSTGLIVESVKKSRTASLSRVVLLLQEHAHDLGEFISNDSRGKHVPAHLAQLAEHLQAEQETNVRELELLRRNVEHIKGIVAIQQDNAVFGGIKEMVNVVNLVEDSLRMIESALRRHQVEVIREFETVPPLNVEKHKILQILVNLLRNAKHACQHSERADKRLTVRVANGDGRIKISVIDNGVGIPPEHLTRIFSHGFTTRKDGHGFGLHSGALAAKEMGGSLTVHSDGTGLGATFTFELPCPIRDNPHE